MITRIVKMVFQVAEVDAFKLLFEEVKDKIQGFEGCKGVQLMQDTDDPGVLFTISQWDSPEHLEKYRNSELFSSTWYQTKLKFAGKPEAWSTREII